MKKNISFYLQWIVTFVITVIANLLVVLILNHADSAFFSDKWWSTWFPIYLLLIVFLIVKNNYNSDKET